MSEVTANGRPADPWAALPRDLAPLLRREAGELAREVVREVRRGMPEYAWVFDQPYGATIVSGIESAVHQFADRVARPAAPRAHTPPAYRRLGECELAHGRGLAALHGAYRLAARVIWRRIIRLGDRCALSVRTVGLLGEAMFAHIDELAAVSVDGYASAQAGQAGVADRRRRQLLAALLTEPPAPRDLVRELARTCDWAPPERVRAVALEPLSGNGKTPRLPESVLAELDGGEPGLLLSQEDLDDPAVRTLLRERRAVTGPAVAPDDAAASMRWARRALGLVCRGVLPDQRPTDATAHLSTLVLLGDVPLLTELVRRVLAPLATLTPKQRDRFAETLLAWLVTRGGAPEVAARLGIHPQTVRYRMRRLDTLFGARLRDPDARFDLELALRALRRDRGHPA
ncbi:MAG TPA: helix-turn-helix domain-containing protein [Pseudonocardiaceae bacterium]|jgi:DNA-binding CsgD family transcriptional regulator|nr:helix-turn-helix domain-containing protein [Pseudonocardiaceae bacterium]